MAFENLYMMNQHANPCRELVNGMYCSLGAGHESPHRVNHEAMDAVRDAQLCRYRKTLEDIAVGMFDAASHADLCRAMQDAAKQALREEPYAR